MKIEVEVGSFRTIAHEIEGDIAKASTGAMRESTPLALAEYRRQILDCGFGTRLANTWRGETYPGSKDSITPAGFIWSNAPTIVEAFARGATIRPVNGGDYLWIPSSNVPRARARVGIRGGQFRNVRGGAMTPEEVKERFRTDFQFRRGKNGTLLAFVDVLAGKRREGSSYRPATARRLKQGREPKLVLMFVLRKTVQMPQLLDLDGPADRWANRFDSAFSRRLGG